MHDAALNLTVLDRRGQPIGLLRLHGLNNRDLTARMSVMMAPTAHATGTGLVATGQLIDEAFAAFPIRKIYVEAAVAALSLYHSGTVEIIQIGGQLKSHQWNGTMFEDVFVGGIYRERWLGSTIRRRLIRTGRL